MLISGIQLKNIIKNSGITINEIVDKSGIPQTTLYGLFKKEIVEKYYLDDLKKAGIEFPKITENTENQNTYMEKIMNTINQAIEIANRSNQSLMENNEFLREELSLANSTIRNYIRQDRGLSSKAS